MAIENVSGRIANSANRLEPPGFGGAATGARQRFDLNGVKMVPRPRITNLFNTYGWRVSGN